MDPEHEDLSFESLNIDLENYFSNTIIPQLFIDRWMKLRKFTPPAMKQFNLAPADIGRSIGELTDNIRFPGIIENIELVTQTHVILEKEIQTTDLRWYQMNVLPYIVRETGLFNGVIITFVDITSRIHDVKELEKLIAEHQLVIDSISHDVKNPLASILLALEIVKNNLGAGAAAEVASSLDIIERSATRIKAMTDDLLLMRRASSIEHAESELLHIENILEDVLLSLTKPLQDADAIIRRDFKVSELHFPRRKLRSVLYNLVSNAVKYCSPDRACEINVSTRLESDLFILQVTDNGIGIAPDKFDAVFTKYYRVQDKLEGTGIGLYLVKEIIRSAGGTISIDSAPDKGSTFTVGIKVAGNTYP